MVTVRVQKMVSHFLRREYLQGNRILERESENFYVHLKRTCSVRKGEANWKGQEGGANEDNKSDKKSLGASYVSGNGIIADRHR